MFYFIRKKIVVDCFINYPYILENYPIRKAIKVAPKWWKDLYRTYEDTDAFLGTKNTYHSMKACAGFTNLFTEAWVLPLWADYQVLTEESGAYAWKSAAKFSPDLTEHNRAQHANTFDQYIHLKAISPWIVFEKTGINFAFIGNDWELLKTMPNMRILPGVLNFKENNYPNVNFFLPKIRATHQLPAGLPFVHLIPLTEKRVEFKLHCLTDAEFLEKSKRTNKFVTEFHSRDFAKTTL
jgi:hypothetical protein